MHASTTRQGMRTTQWSVVRALRSPDEHERERAHDTIARTYWPAIYSYLRRSGHNRDAAEELAQDFFVTVVCGRRLIERADPGRGRLRTLLLAALKNHLIDGVRRSGCRPASTAARIGAAEHEERLLPECPADGDAAFDARWRALVLEQAVESCRAAHASDGRSRDWEAFEARCLRPALSLVAPPPFRDLAARLGYTSDATAAAAVQRVRERLAMAISEAVAATVEPDAFESELAFVRGAAP